MSDPPQVSPELLESMATMLSQALRASLPGAAAAAGPELANAANNGHLRAPRFNMAEYRPTEGTTVQDYFTRFSWALELSEIPAEQHANYARVYMGRDLNDALKFLISPRLPQDLTYAEIQQTLIKHFDHAKNKFAESYKFRKLTQNPGESVADFALRLKQGAVYCEFDAFLDRMLIEQLLFGLESQVTCDEIIAKKPASFAEAFEIANSLEATRLTSDTVKNKVEPTNKLGFAPLKLKYTKRLNQGRPHTQPQGVHKPTGSPYQPRQSQDKQWACQGCGGQHARSQCPYRDATCHACNKKGHLASVCRSGNIRQVRENSDSEEDFPAEEVDQMRRLNKMDVVNSVKFPGKVVLDVLINGRNIKMEIDTGAPCAIMSKQTLDSVKIKYKLLETNQQFASFSGHRISCLGRVSVNAQIGSSVWKLDLYLADGIVDSLLGREWIVAFANKINFSTFFGNAASVHAVNPVSPRPSLQQQAQLDSILTQFESSFDDKPGKLIGPPVKLHFKPGYKPVFSRARDVPYALRDAYAREIDAKLNSDVYKRVEYSEWASMTHVVAKKNRKLRITENYKPTLNPQLIVDEHPIPRMECIFNKMRGAKWFCHLDITDAYTHLTIDDECAHAMTLNTPTHGLIRPTRAVYGAANIPAVWQR
ncbi:uncharacterized protein K02A2.6-like [Agrilus planipennis]|uniref:Uncharacterized protein K02A2.6-like n=1 Tax=Agrilus planipennis TaxID=224129 RepID=A0A1W4XMZ7_AGRPL|nr:uncharacterized protein K02A2.6-like [Agrilus planipennis]